MHIKGRSREQHEQLFNIQERDSSLKEKVKEDKVIVVQRRVRKNGFDLPFGFF